MYININITYTYIITHSSSLSQAEHCPQDGLQEQLQLFEIRGVRSGVHGEFGSLCCSKPVILMWRFWRKAWQENGVFPFDRAGMSAPSVMPC